MVWTLILVSLSLVGFSMVFLKLSKDTSTGPEIQHFCYIGVTRHGKTEACISRNGPRMLAKDRPAFVVLDPPGGMTKRFGTYLAIHGKEFFYDSVSETKNVPGYGFYPRSTNPDPEQREAEDRQMVSDAISQAVRAEGKTDAQKNKMILRGLTDAFLLYIYQDTDVPFYILKDCFCPETDAAQYLVKHCTNPEVVFRFRFYHALQGQQREFHVGAAERRLVEMCSCPQFRKRCQATFDFAAFLNNGGILLMDGSSKGNLSREDAALVMGTVLLRTIALARAGQLTRRVVIIVDEGMNSGLLDGNTARAMREAGKWGLEFHVLLQNVTFADPEIGEAITGSVDVMYFFKQVSPKAATFAAEICGTMTYDPMRVKEVITRIRMEHSGEIDIRKIEHTNESEDEHGNKRRGKAEGHIAVPRYHERHDDTIVRFTDAEHIRLECQRMMTHPVGCCTIKDGIHVVHFDEPLPMLKMPERAFWPFQASPRITLGERKLQVYLDSLKSHPAYQTPEPFVCTIPQKSRKSGME